MTSMIERIAKGIYEKRNGTGCKPWSLLTKEHKEPYRLDARAALDAAWLPTEAMVEAGSCRDPKDSIERNTVLTWHAMVSAALEESP